MSFLNIFTLSFIYLKRDSKAQVFPCEFWEISKNTFLKEKIDAIIYVQALNKGGKISEDIYPLFDETYLQKYEEYFGGTHIGSYENGELYKGIVYSLVL